MNERGETRFHEGDVLGALKLFAEAVQVWNEDPLLFSNLATALHAIRRSDEAWERLLDSLHLDPDFQVARDNLRMVAATLGRVEEAEHILHLFGEDTTGGEPAKA